MVTPQSQNVHTLPQKRIRFLLAYGLFVFCNKNILEKLVGYQQPTCLCVKMEFVVGTISLSCGLFSLSKARAGLKPMHPMQLHWAPPYSGAPRQMVIRQVVHFWQIFISLKNY